MPLNLRLIPAWLLLLGGCTSTQTMLSVPVYDTRAAENFLLLNIQARSDSSPADEWRSCELTLQLAYGDCEDFASCAWELVAHWYGCSSDILVVHGARMLHAVTTLACENGLSGYFDNGAWVNGDARQDYAIAQYPVRWLGTSRAAHLTGRSFGSL